jgi:hypothetical protein
MRGSPVSAARVHRAERALRLARLLVFEDRHEVRALRAIHRSKARLEPHWRHGSADARATREARGFGPDGG